MNLDLRGKRAFVCGSTQGIGKAAALELALLGAEVVLIARDEEALKKTIGELDRSSGQTHQSICADFNLPEELAKKAQEFIAKNGDTYRAKDLNGKEISEKSYPQVEIAMKLSEQLLRLEQHFGMTPSARSNIKITPKARASEREKDNAKYFGVS